MVTPYYQQKPVRRSPNSAGIDLGHSPLGGAPELDKIANVRTVGGIVYPSSPLAANKEELQNIAEYWPNIAKSGAEARRLCRGGAERLTFELVNRNIDRP